MRKPQFSPMRNKFSKDTHTDYRLSIVLITLNAIWMYFYFGYNIWYSVGMFAMPFVFGSFWMIQNYLSGDFVNLGMD